MALHLASASLLISALVSLSTPLYASANEKLQLRLSSQSDYLCYYGSWDDEKIFRAQDFNLVILEPSHINASQVQQLKRGHDGIAGTDDDVVVIGYLSVGEDHLGTHTGDGRGPCYYSYDSARVVYENKGVASWYVDDADKNGTPDADPIWKSAYVNAGDSLWWEFLKTNPNGADTILTALGCDGLFLDLLDIATPWAPWPYRWTVGGMSDLVAWLRATYPDKFLIGNRGLFYFDPSTPVAYSRTIRPYIDGIMFESYALEGNRGSWAQKLNTEAAKPDGFKIIALDYFAEDDSAGIAKQLQEVNSYGWTDYISAVTLDVIRYDVFHRHTPDVNPPTWNASIGLVSAVAGDESVTLRWGALRDQSLPLRFDLYFTKDAPFSFAAASKVSPIVPAFDSSSMKYVYTIGGLINHSRYEFVVRASDALGNSESNVVVQSATPPLSGGSGGIIIDGAFDDWVNVSYLNAPPNPPVATGGTVAPEADFVNFWATNDTSSLYVSYQVAGTLTASYFYHVFIDTDADTSTGYRMNDSAAVGADLMLENNYLYAYTGTGGNNWSWKSAAGLSKKDASSRTEFKIPRATFPTESPAGRLRFLFNVNSAAPPYGNVEIEPGAFGTNSYGYTLTGTTGIDVALPALPGSYYLEQNYPNPFNPSTTIRFSVPVAGHVTLAVFDLLGREVAVLVDGAIISGTHQATFIGSSLSAGCYFVRLTTPLGVLTEKILLVK
jgi:hypothetical protein